MWSSVEDDFATILSTRVIHTVADDSGYMEIFRKAGFKGRLPTALSQAPAAALQQLNIAARMCAQLLRMDVDSKKSLRERRAKAVVIEGPAVPALVEQGWEPYRAVVVHGSPAARGTGTMQER